jgi:uncharacterized membrane protein YbhN (UPF0104 family)
VFGVVIGHQGGRWAIWAVTALLFAGLLACLIVLINLIPKLQLQLVFPAKTNCLLLLSYSAAVGLSGILWKNLVRTCTGSVVDWSKVLVGIAAVLLGKYLPGKVVGLTGRLLTVSVKTGVVPATLVTVLEQSYVLAGLLIFAAIASVALPGESQKLWALAVPILGVVIAYLPYVCELALRRFWAQGEFIIEFRALLATLSPLSSLRFLMLAVAIAAAVCAPAWLLPSILGMELSLGGRAALMAAYSLSIVLGMMALILPGGIGVREGAFVMMTQSLLTLDAAIAAAALLRLINVVADLIIGCLGFAVWKAEIDKG